MAAGAAALFAALASVWSVIDPQYMAILPVEQLGAVMRQCSRSVPAAGEHYWRPAPALIAEMEAKVHDLVAQGQHLDERARPTFPHRYTRQYVGYERDGRRYVYGNYAPLFDEEIVKGSHWHDKPVVVCDGGRHVFGVEYDVVKHEVSNIAFNGAA